MNIKDIRGQTFNRLTVIDFIPKSSTSSGGWLCKCICGNFKKAYGSKLRTGFIKSCGCLKTETVTLRNIQGIKLFTESKTFYQEYRRRAKNKNIDFLLSFDKFYDIINSNCFYCNSFPEKRVRARRELSMSGIDRIDSKLGYTEDNVRPCCSKCNYSKNSMSQNEFKIHIQNIYNHWIKNDST